MIYSQNNSHFRDKCLEIEKQITIKSIPMEKIGMFRSGVITMSIIDRLNIYSVL